MFGSEAPPWRTMIFDGGQFVDPPVGPPLTVLPLTVAFAGAEPGWAEPPAAEPSVDARTLLQLTGSALFFCFLAGGLFGPAGVCAGAEDPGLDEVGGFCAGVADPLSSLCAAAGGWPTGASCDASCKAAADSSGVADARQMPTRKMTARVIPVCQAAKDRIELMVSFCGADCGRRSNAKPFPRYRCLSK